MDSHGQHAQCFGNINMGEQDNSLYSALEPCKMNRYEASRDNMIGLECYMFSKTFFLFFLVIRDKYISIESGSALDRLEIAMENV